MVKMQPTYDSQGERATPDKTAMTMLGEVSSSKDERSSRIDSLTLQQDMEDEVLSRTARQESLVALPSLDTPPYMAPSFSSASRSKYSSSASISWLRENYTCSIHRRAARGALVGGLLALAILAICAMIETGRVAQLGEWYLVPQNNSNNGRIRGEGVPNGISSYLSLFPKRLSRSSQHQTSELRNSASMNRRLADIIPGSGSGSGSSSGSNNGGSYKDPQLVIAGKMTVEDAPCNIAQFNMKTQEWSLTERIQLSLYNSYSGGEVYSLLANHTNQVYDDSGEDKETSR